MSIFLKKKTNLCIANLCAVALKFTEQTCR